MRAQTVDGHQAVRALERHGAWVIHKYVLKAGRVWTPDHGYTVSLESEGLALASGLGREAASCLAEEAQRLCPDGDWRKVKGELVAACKRWSE